MSMQLSIHRISDARVTMVSPNNEHSVTVEFETDDGGLFTLALFGSEAVMNGLADALGDVDTTDFSKRTEVAA